MLSATAKKHNRRFGNPFVLLMIAWLLPCAAFAQYNDHSSVNVDSLEQVLAAGNLSDDELLKCYMEISHEYKNYPQKALQYAKMGLSMVKKNSNTKIIAGLYFQSALAYYDLTDFDSSFIDLKKTVEILSAANDASENILMGKALPTCMAVLHICTVPC